MLVKLIQNNTTKKLTKANDITNTRTKNRGNKTLQAKDP